MQVSYIKALLLVGGWWCWFHHRWRFSRLWIWNVFGSGHDELASRIVDWALGRVGLVLVVFGTVDWMFVAVDTRFSGAAVIRLGGEATSYTSWALVVS